MRSVLRACHRGRDSRCAKISKEFLRASALAAQSIGYTELTVRVQCAYATYGRKTRLFLHVSSSSQATRVKIHILLVLARKHIAASATLFRVKDTVSRAERSVPFSTEH